MVADNEACSYRGCRVHRPRRPDAEHQPIPNAPSGLSAADRAQIVADWEAGYRVGELADTFGVTRYAIQWALLRGSVKYRPGFNRKR